MSAGKDPVWPVPDMTVLNGGRRPAVPMPWRLFGPAWTLLTATAEGTSTPVDYAAVAYLATCASLIGGKRRVRPYATSNWSEPCILWCGVVGDPSARKSPALEAVTGPLSLLEHDLADHYVQSLREWRGQVERAKAAEVEWEKAVKMAVQQGSPTPSLPEDAIYPVEPVRRRTLVMDATPEALGVVLAGNPMGTLYFRDELSGWLQSFDRYSPGGREFWLEAYGGRPFVIDRKGSKDPIMIPFNGVSVLGGIQPEKLADTLLASSDDGLLARIIMAWPDKIPPSRPKKGADLGQLVRIYRRMEGLAFGSDGEGREVPIVLPLSDSAADVFEKWQVANSQTDEDAGRLFKSFVGKMDGTVLRLALVSELAAWAQRDAAEPTAISEDCLSAATEWVDRYAKPMAERVYGDAALPPTERNAATLARYIRKQGFRQINKRELKRSPHKTALPQLRVASVLDAAVDHLVDAGWLMEAHTRQGGTQGRLTATYAVNPAVFGDGR